MARQVINTGTLALNGQDGDTNRDASTKINANFAELYAENGNFIRGAGVVVAGAIAVFAGTTGDQLGSRPASDFEPAIAVGTAAQYRNGLKALVDFGASVRAAVLTGLSVASSAAVASTDNVLDAMGKLQGQINSSAAGLAGNVRSTALAGLSVASGAVITATDTVLSAFGKLQAQITAAATAAAIALRSVTPAADTIAYFTGATAAATTAFTAKARALLARTDSAGMRTEIGADVTLASAVLDPQSAGGLMSMTTVSGFTVFKYLNGQMIVQGPIPSTGTISANADFTVSVAIPVTFVGTTVLKVNLFPTVGNSFTIKNEQAPGATAYAFCNNGSAAQAFSGSLLLVGRWK